MDKIFEDLKVFCVVCIDGILVL